MDGDPAGIGVVVDASARTSALVGIGARQTGPLCNGIVGQAVTICERGRGGGIIDDHQLPTGREYAGAAVERDAAEGASGASHTAAWGGTHHTPRCESARQGIAEAEIISGAYIGARWIGERYGEADSARCARQHRVDIGCLANLKIRFHHRLCCCHGAERGQLTRRIAIADRGLVIQRCARLVAGDIAHACLQLQDIVVRSSRAVVGVDDVAQEHAECRTTDGYSTPVAQGDKGIAGSAVDVPWILRSGESDGEHPLQTRRSRHITHSGR